MTRLYPVTTRPEVLERLAGVPAGTSAAADQLAQELARLDGLDYDAWDAAISRAGEAANALHDFRLFGWGRFQGASLAAAAGHDPEAGRSSDERLVAAVLLA